MDRAPISPPATEPIPQPLPSNPTSNKKWLKIAAVVSILAGLGLLGVYAYQNYFQSTPTPRLSTDRKPSNGVYEGLYFSFQYPNTWKDESTVGLSSNTLEQVDLRIIPLGRAVFGASYKSYDYQQGVKIATNDPRVNEKSQVLTVGGREATRIDTPGGQYPDDALGAGQSIVEFIVKGGNGSSYQIVFNGTTSDIPESLISQVLSTLKFTP